MKNTMDYTQTVLAAELLGRRQNTATLSSFEEELLCLQEQAAEAKVSQKNVHEDKPVKRTREDFSRFQWFVLGTGSN